MARALLQQARRVEAGSHDLLGRRWRGADATYGGKVGMHVEHFAESRLIIIWGSNSIASQPALLASCPGGQARAARSWSCIDPAQDRDRRQVPRASSHCCPAPTARWRWALMHELIVNGWLDHDYIERHTQRLGGAARARAAMAARACGRGVRHRRRRRCVGLARDYGTTQPAAIRLNYGMQRVRGGGNAARLIAMPAVPHRRMAPSRRRSAAVRSGWFPRDTAALQRPELLAGRTPRTINMSTIGDALLREASPGSAPRSRR